MVMRTEWRRLSAVPARSGRFPPAAGHPPRPPLILTNVCCAESRSEAQERAVKYLGQKWQSIDDHYHFSDGHLSTVKGYDSYGKTARAYARINDSPQNNSTATDCYVIIQI